MISGKKAKILIFGRPKGNLEMLGLRDDASLPPLAGADGCAAATLNDHHTESAAAVSWNAHELAGTIGPAMRRRPFTRFDFTDEWNNLGFGRISTDGSIWSAQGGIRAAGAVELASIRLRNGDGESYAGSYMTLLDLPEASILWCARPVGPVDSVEWSVIENFVSDWRADELPCRPRLLQTPAGCSALATMRLDCDEDIASARDVFEWYADEGIPFSLAVKTSLPMGAEDVAMLRDVLAAGGSLLSHSHLHAPNWGASYGEALKDAGTSRDWFAALNLPTPRMADSPFHTNPDYALRAVRDAGFEGLVSGIIHNDPESLLGRAGQIPGAAGPLASISEQCMLHGDCFAAQGGVETYVQAFDLQYAASGIFGWLDHPFSSRYQYGWKDKNERLGAHRELVREIRKRNGVVFWNQEQCLDFVKMLQGINFEVDDTGVKAVVGAKIEKLEDFKPVYRWKGREYEIH